MVAAMRRADNGHARVDAVASLRRHRQVPPNTRDRIPNKKFFTSKLPVARGDEQATAVPVVEHLPGVVIGNVLGEERWSHGGYEDREALVIMIVEEANG